MKSMLFPHPHPLTTTCRGCGHVGLRVTVATGSRGEIDILRCPECEALFVWDDLTLARLG